jgi:hypothetical protein
VFTEATKLPKNAPFPILSFQGAKEKFRIFESNPAFQDF